MTRYAKMKMKTKRRGAEHEYINQMNKYVHLNRMARILVLKFFPFVAKANTEFIVWRLASPKFLVFFFFGNSKSKVQKDNYRPQSGSLGQSLTCDSFA